MLEWTIAPFGNELLYYYSDIMDFMAEASDLGNTLVLQFLENNWGPLSERYQRLYINLFSL